MDQDQFDDVVVRLDALENDFGNLEADLTGLENDVQALGTLCHQLTRELAELRVRLGFTSRVYNCAACGRKMSGPNDTCTTCGRDHRNYPLTGTRTQRLEE